VVVTRSLARRGWSVWRLIGALGVVLLGGVITSEAWVELGRLALTPRGMVCLPLVPAAALWLAWVRRQRLRYCEPGGSLLAPLVVLLGWLLYGLGLGDGGAVQSGGSALALHAGAWAVAFGCCLGVCRDLVHRFMPAFLALAFLVPSALVLEGQWASAMHGWAMEVIWTVSYGLGLSAVEEGGADLHHLGLVLSEMGSGLQAMLAICVVSYAFAFGRPLRGGVRALIVGLSPVAGVLCSLVGLVVTVWLVGQSVPHSQYPWVISQWVILAVALVALGGLLRVLAWASVPLRAYPLASVDQQ